MASIEHRGESVRVTWRVGGGRGGAKVSCTFSGPLQGRVALATAAKALAESRSHNLTREECYAAILGPAASAASRVPTFEQWAKDWLAGLERRREVQPDVLTKYRQAFEARVYPFLGHKRLDEIGQEVLQEWVGYMTSQRITRGSRNLVTGGRRLSAASVRRTHAYLHACLGAAVPKWIAVNPAARQAGSRKSPSGLPKAEQFEAMFLDRWELRRILSCCGEHLHDMVLVASRSGLRLGELCALEARHVVLSPRGAVIQVRQSLKNDRSVGLPKSEKSRRDVPVGGAAAAVLRGRVAGRARDALVFPSPRGKLWCENNFNNRYWQRAVAQARRCAEHPPPLPPKPRSGPARLWRVDEVSSCGCEGVLLRTPRFHDLRHSHASFLIEKRWSAKKIQGRLGHANYQTTMNVYGHLMNNGDDGELDDLDDWLG